MQTRCRQVALCACAWAATGGRGSETRPWQRKAAELRAGPALWLCDFGFDLPGDELIPPYDKPRGDRKNGCGAICVAMGTIARARVRGASLEKHSLCRRHVSLTAPGASGCRDRVFLPPIPQWGGSGAPGRAYP